MGFAKEIITDEFFRDGSIGTIRNTANNRHVLALDRSFAVECVLRRPAPASISCEQSFGKSQDALDDIDKKMLPHLVTCLRWN